jgi:hypothetical protein
MRTILPHLASRGTADEHCPPVGRLALARPRCSCHAGLVEVDEPVRETTGRSALLLRYGRILEGVTLGWNVAGIVILALAAVAVRSVALAGFGLDSLIEIGASTVVLWELSGSGEGRQRRALRLIGGAFVALAAYLIIQSVLVLVTGYRPPG